MGLTIPMYSYAQSFVNFFSVPPPPPTRKPNLGPEYDDNASKRMYFWPPVAHPIEQQDASSIEHVPYAAPSKSWADVPTKSFSAPRFVPSSPTVTIASTASTSSDDTRAEHDVERPSSPSHDTRRRVPPASLSPHSAQTSDSVPVPAQDRTTVTVPSIHNDSGSDAPNGVATTSSPLPVVPSSSTPYSSAPSRTKPSSPPPSHDVAGPEGENVETDVPGVDTTKPRDLGPGNKEPNTLSSPPNDNDAHLPENLPSSSPDSEANDVVPRPSRDSSPSNLPSTAPPADRSLPAPSAAEVTHVPERDGPDVVVADGIDEETPTADDTETDPSGEPSVNRAVDDVDGSSVVSGPIPLPPTPPKDGANAEQDGPDSPRDFEPELEVDASPPTLSPPTSTPLDPTSPIPTAESSAAGAQEGFDAEENVPPSAQDPESSSNSDDRPSGAGKDSSSAQELPVVHEPEDEVLSLSEPACEGSPSNIVTHPPNDRDVVPSISDSPSVSDGDHSGQGEPTLAPTASDKAQEGGEGAAVKQTKEEEHETLNERSPSLPLESSSLSLEEPSSPSTTSEAEAIPDSFDPHEVIEPDLPSDPLPPSSADEDALLARGPSASGLEKLIPSNDDSAHRNEGDKDPFAASEQSTGVPPIQDAVSVPHDNTLDMGDAPRDAGGQDEVQPSTDLAHEEPVTVEEDASEEPITGPVALSAPDPPSALPEQSATAEEPSSEAEEDGSSPALPPSSPEGDHPAPILEGSPSETNSENLDPVLDDSAPPSERADATRSFDNLDDDPTTPSLPTSSLPVPLPAPSPEIAVEDFNGSQDNPPKLQDAVLPTSPSSAPGARPDDEDIPESPYPPSPAFDSGNDKPEKAPEPISDVPVLSSPPASPRATAHSQPAGADASPVPPQPGSVTEASAAPSTGHDVSLNEDGSNHLHASSDLSNPVSDEAGPADSALNDEKLAPSPTILPSSMPVEPHTPSRPSTPSQQLHAATQPSAESASDRTAPSHNPSRSASPEPVLPVAVAASPSPNDTPNLGPDVVVDAEEANEPVANSDVKDGDVGSGRETPPDAEGGIQLAADTTPSAKSNEPEADVDVETPAVDLAVPDQSSELQDDTNAGLEADADVSSSTDADAVPEHASPSALSGFGADNLVDTVDPGQEPDEAQQADHEARAAHSEEPNAESTFTDDTNHRDDPEPPSNPAPSATAPEPALDQDSDSDSIVSASPRSITPSLSEGPPPAYGEDESYDQPPPPPPVQATPGRDQNGLFAPAAPKAAEPPAPPPEPVASNEPEPVEPESAAPGTSSEAAAATFLGDKPPFKPAPNKAEFQSLRNYFTGITLCSEGEERGFPNDLMAAKCGRGDYIEIWAFEDANEAPNAYRIANLNSGLYLAYQDRPHAGNIVTLEDDGSLWELRAVGTAGLKYILPYGTSLALDVPEAADMAPRTAVQPVLQYASDKESQMWADFDYNPR